MRQFFILFGFFMCFPVLADHGSSSNYNGRTFSCNNFSRARNSATTHKGAGDYYNLGLCELHRGHLMPGIATLKQAASMGEAYAAIAVAGYYASDGYILRVGQSTKKEPNLLKAIEYEEKALSIIRQSNYPFNDPHGDYRRIEREDYPYLRTLSNLTGNYMSLFAARILRNINNVGSWENIGNATVEALRNAAEAANRCLSVSYDSSIWNERAYNSTMAICREDKRIAETLLPLEGERLQVAHANCRKNVKLSNCEAHNRVEDRIYELYSEYLSISARLLANL